MTSAFDYLTDNGGIMAQEDYQYTTEDVNCQYDQSSAKVQLKLIRHTGPRRNCYLFI